jgi:ferrous iron transport protein A
VGAAVTGTSTVPLADLRPGMSGRVLAIDGGVEPSTARRLIDLGFAPGRQVTVVRKAPMGDPVIVSVADYELALRKAQTSCIRVARTS